MTPRTLAAAVARDARPSGAAGGQGRRPRDVQLTQRVLADLQRQVELMLEVRLREALAPILARATDALVRDARKELTAAMRDIVSRSIATRARPARGPLTAAAPAVAPVVDESPDADRPGNCVIVARFGRERSRPDSFQ